MSRLRSHFNLRVAFALLLLITGGALLALSATDNAIGRVFTRPEIGTIEQQERVRTSREVTELPLRSACTVKPARELFITHRSVVDDCYRTTWGSSCPQPVQPATRGAWTLGRLLEGIFGTTDPVVLSDRTLTWLNEWKVDQTINSDLVPARPAIQTKVIGPWLEASGGTRLDMQKAPFRLQAIVTRLDLRNLSENRGGPHAGEARFVFNLIDAAGEPTLFNLILEYQLDASNCSDIKDWAQDFHALGSIPFGPEYNAALEAITDRFTAIDASPNKRNGSAISQVRSNEIALRSPWELREFRLAGNFDSALLLQSTVAQTPIRSHQRSPLLADFINTNSGSIKNNNYSLRLIWNDQPFRGGASRHNLDLGWDGPQLCTTVTDERARQAFSLNTCSGCHGTPETGTQFLHVVPRAATEPAALSGFLTGISLTDPCGNATDFNDIDRRRVDLCQLLEKTCTQIEQEPPVTFAH